jgi:glyceraldehyde 3-phosphate dehydrogenase
MDRPPRIGINGFGRIGRLVTRALLEQEPKVDIVGINDLLTSEMLSHLFRHDSVHGPFKGTVETAGDDLVFNGDRFRTLTERNPVDLPWKDLGADYVVECTGRFRTQKELQGHLDAGARRVILSAPGKGVDVTIVRGVNDDAYDPAKHRTISNASCTTNCLAPVLKVLHESFTVKRAIMTTVHAYTNDQRLLDSQHKDPRRARAAALSMIPTSTGAAKAIGLVLPELDGLVDGMAIRVPTPNVSVVDLTAMIDTRVTRDDVADAFRQAADGSLAGILRCEADPLVSADFNHDPASAVVDLPSLMVVDGKLLKVLAWYDNEWAYATRTAELVRDVARAEPE